MSDKEFGAAFESMAHIAETGELPPEWGEVDAETMKLLNEHYASHHLASDKTEPRWELFFAE